MFPPLEDCGSPPPRPLLPCLLASAAPSPPHRPPAHTLFLLQHLPLICGASSGPFYGNFLLLGALFSFVFGSLHLHRISAICLVLWLCCYGSWGLALLLRVLCFVRVLCVFWFPSSTRPVLRLSDARMLVLYSSLTGSCCQQFRIPQWCKSLFDCRACGRQDLQQSCIFHARPLAA